MSTVSQLLILRVQVSGAVHSNINPHGVVQIAEEVRIARWS